MNSDIVTLRVGHWLVNLLGTRPRTVLGLVVLCSIALSFGATKLRTDFSFKSYVSEDDPLYIQFKDFEDNFGNDDTLIVALHSPSGIFDEESLSLLQNFTTQMEKVEDVVRVSSLANHTQIHSVDDELRVEPLLPQEAGWTDDVLKSLGEAALADGDIRNYLLSSDGQTALIFIQLRPGLDEPIDFGVSVSETRGIVNKLTAGDHRFFIAGGPAITIGFQEEATKDLTVLLPLMLVLVVFCLAWTLKSIVSVFLALAVVVFSIVATFGIAGWIDIPITNSSSFLPQILIAIGIADAVHILTAFLRALSHGNSNAEAARYTLIKNFQPTLLTSVSTAIGFFSFVGSPIQSTAHVGLLAGTGVLFAWVYSYGVLGPLLFILPIKRRLLAESNRGDSLVRSKKFLGGLVRHRVLVLTLFGVVVVGTSWLALQNRVNADPYEYFSDDVPVKVANDFVLKQIGGIRGVNLIVRTGSEGGARNPEFLKKVDRLQNWIEDIPEVTRTISLVTILKAMNRSFNNDQPEFHVVPETQAAVSQFLLLYTMGLPESADLNHMMTENEEELHISILWGLSDSTNWIAGENKILDHARSMGLDATITGKGSIFQHLSPYLVETFIESMSIALVLMSLLLVFVFRSIKLGCLALLTNCIPLIGGAAIFYLAGRSVDFGSVLVASVCLGIAVDDTIHILSNYTRLRGQGITAYDAMAEVLEHTGSALIITTVILVLGFGTLALGDFIPNVYFGTMTAVILSIAIVVDITFLPAILVKKTEENHG